MKKNRPTEEIDTLRIELNEYAYNRKLSLSEYEKFINISERTLMRVLQSKKSTEPEKFFH